MARFDLTDKDIEWNVVNMPGVQSELRAVAQKGAAIGRFLATPHIRTGDLYSGIEAAPDTFTRGKNPVGDWLVLFGRDHIIPIEYGHIQSGRYGHVKGRVEGLRIASRTFRAMQGG